MGLQVSHCIFRPLILHTLTDYVYLLGARDVSISPRIQPRATEPLRSFQITLTVDGISQEFDETFSIEFSQVDLTDFFLFPDEAPVTINSLEGTIIDQDGEFC